MPLNSRHSDSLLIGSHMSIAGGVANAIALGESIQCTAIQVFVKNNSRWDFPPLTRESAARFRDAMKQAQHIRACVAHNIYLVNLASSNPLFARKSTEDMLDELRRCDALGIPGLVMHPGAHGGAGLETGIAQVARAINEIIAADRGGKCRILLETTAGQGSSIGGRFEHLAEIVRRVKNKRRIGICLDTCHVFTAGYDIRTKKTYDAMWRDFDAHLGIENLRAIHLNDSKKPLGSHLDRHEHIGKGELGLEPFRLLLNDRRLREIPMVLETPKNKTLDEDIMNLRVLRSLILAK